MENVTLFTALLAIEGAVSVILASSIIYRSILGLHEDDQIFLDQAEAALEKSYAATLDKILKLDRVIRRTAIVFAILFVAIAAIWTYNGFFG